MGFAELNMTVRYCDAGGMCQDKKAIGLPCAANNECLSGECDPGDGCVAPD